MGVAAWQGSAQRSATGRELPFPGRCLAVIYRGLNHEY